MALKRNCLVQVLSKQNDKDEAMDEYYDTIIIITTYLCART